MLGTSFFAKRKFMDEPCDYRDSRNGPQGFCRRFGALLSHQVEVRRLSPSREYGSYPDWPTAHGHLRAQRHLEEVVKEGCPCKPYLDLERDGGLAEGEGLETVIAAFQETIVRIFREDYSLELLEEAFNWIPCDYGPGGKFSLHLVISSHFSQHVYRSNLASPVDPQGAGHLARRLGQLLSNRHSELIDQSVYTRNRGIRLPYCSKPSTPLSRLIPLDESRPRADSCITWFDNDVRTITVPDSIPDVVQARQPRTRPEHFRYLSPKAADVYAVQRCTELIQALHPTAYRRGSTNSLSFNWYDRTEPCYSGHTHSGARDILCIVVPERNAILAKCCSERMDPGTGVCCKELPAHYLGALYVDCDTWRHGALEVDVRYLNRDPLVAAPLDMWQIASGFRPMTDDVIVNDVLNK
jgi:hypothetical protein